MEMNNNFEETAAQIIENLISIHPLITKGITRSVRLNTNLNPGNLYVLGILYKYEILTMSEIGMKLSMPKPHVTAHIDKLIAEKMVERIADETDRRIVKIRLSERGKQDFLQIKTTLSLGMKERIEKLSPDKMNLFYESSKQVREILLEIMNDKNSEIIKRK